MINALSAAVEGLVLLLCHHISTGLCTWNWL